MQKEDDYVSKELKKCLRCGHIWLPRETTKIIKTCPKCRSPYWDTPRQENKKKKN